jgi:hypothetical protein
LTALITCDAELSDLPPAKASWSDTHTFRSTHIRIPLRFHLHFDGGIGQIRLRHLREFRRWRD